MPQFELMTVTELMAVYNRAIINQDWQTAALAAEWLRVRSQGVASKK